MIRFFAFIFALFLSHASGQCDICSALGNGFCPLGSGATAGPNCISCSSSTTNGCSTCGGGACYTSLAACNAVCNGQTPPPTSGPSAPRLTAFDVQPRTTQSTVTATFTAVESGAGVFLATAELWRAVSNPTNCFVGTTSGCSWSVVQTLSNPTGSDLGPWSSTIVDSPPLVASYLYGLHIKDTAGSMVTETQSGLQVIPVVALFGSSVCSAGKVPESGLSYAQSVIGAIGAGQKKCFNSNYGPEVLLGFALDATTLDSYDVEFGTVTPGTFFNDCTGFSTSVSGSALISCGASLCTGSRRLGGIPSGSVSSIRISCKNSAFNCDFTSSSLLQVAACNAITTTSTTTTSTTRATSASSSSSTSSTTSAPSVWAGTYQINPGCNLGACCCLSGQVVVTQSGTTVSVQSPIAGQCGTLTSPTSFSFVLSSSTATTASATVLGQAFTFTKSGNVVTATNLAAPGCSGSATLGTTTTTTTRSGSTTTSPSGGSATPCFHESTVITYKGRDYHLKDFQSADAADSNTECRVPHIVKSDGVRIATGHGAFGATVLRLTGDHLVFTGRGLIAADQITTADTLFGPTGERITVASIDHESNQVYFGLNCLESVVYANGIRTSTFGKYHKIPEMWMKYAGSLLGVHRASSIGDSIVELLARARII
jgi:hypothetical protein